MNYKKTHLEIFLSELGKNCGIFPISSVLIIPSYRINPVITVAHKRDIFRSLRIDVPLSIEIFELIYLHEIQRDRIKN